MTTPTTPNQPDPTPNRAFVEATFDYMRNAIERRDGDGLVNALHALRSELGDDRVNAMLDYLLKVGTQRVIQRMADDATKRSFTARGHGCPMCVDGWQPEGIHPVLGPVFVACEFTRMCTACGGCSWFPTDRTALHLRATRLTASGYTVLHCPACLGVTDVRPHRGEPR